MEEPKTILIADDESRMRRIITDYLTIKGYRVLEAEDGLQVLSVMEQKKVDLILLDVMMPRMDGWETCRRIRRRSQVPVIMLTARSEEEDELQGFSLGVDEYITKPFSLKVLAARIEAVLRRGESVPTDGFSAPPGLSVDTDGRVVRVNGTVIDLTYTEFELLTYLMTNRGIALSRDRILDNVWRFDYDGDARTVDTHVKKLRNKLGEKGDHIQTVRGIGYKFVPTPEEKTS